MLAVTALVLPSVALACEEVSPQAARWAQCAYQVAHSEKLDAFFVGFASDKLSEKTPDAAKKAKWDRLSNRIVKSCGAYADAATADRRTKLKSSYFVPHDEFMAIVGSTDLDKLVKH